jgi:cytochrome P450
MATVSDGTDLVLAGGARGDAAGPDDLPRMPFERTGVLDIAPALRELQARQPIIRVRTPAGDLAWLVTRHELARTLFADQRLGRSHPGGSRAAQITGAALLGGPMGEYETEKADHAAMRRVLAPSFSARRIRSLRDRIDGLVRELMDRMADLGPPADLHERLSVPLPVLVICELLGVPYEDRAEFRAWSDDVGVVNDPDRAAAAYTALVAYMRGLIERKRKEPAEDVISDLVATVGAAGTAAGPEADDGIAQMAAGLLFAGHETTVTRIDVGTLLLLTHPRQRMALRRDPGLAPRAVEEILRVAAPGDTALPRYAHTDIEIGDVVIRMGEAVLLLPMIANRDPDVFTAPDDFDITREPGPHLAFGYGPRLCVGASLARAELVAVFSTLLRRFPWLDLATGVEQLRVRRDQLTGGIAELPVTW